MIMKKKYRHILVNSSAEIDFLNRENERLLKDALLDFMGEDRFAGANPRVIKTIDRNNFVMNCMRGYERDIVLALAFAKEINGVKTGFYTLKISGTIKGLAK